MSRIYPDCIFCQELFNHLIKLIGYSSKNKEQDPAKRYSKAKQPFEKGWKEKSITIEEAEKWIERGGWLGCVVPEGYILVDIDNKELGEKLDRLLSEHLTFITIETPNGWQFLFKDAGKVNKQQAKFLCAGGFPVDFRLAGKGYFVFPTENTEGRRFVRVPEKLEDISPMPNIFIPIRSKKDDDEILTFPIPDGHRNNTLFSHAGRLRELLTRHRKDLKVDEFLLQVLKEINLFFCVPPLEEKEVEKIVKSSMRYLREEAQTTRQKETKSKEPLPEEDMIIEESEGLPTFADAFSLDYSPFLGPNFIIKEDEKNKRYVIYKKIEKKRGGTEYHRVGPAFVVSKYIKIEGLVREEEGEAGKIGEEEEFLVELSSFEKTAVVNISLNDRKELEKVLSNFLGLTFTSKQITMLREYIAEYQWYNKSQIPVVRGVQTTGWYGDEFLIPTVSKDVVWVNQRLLEAYTVRGKFDEELFRKILFTPAGQVLLGALSAPLLNPLELPNYILATTGLTGTGKTTAVRYAMSLFGNPDKLGVTWFTTKAGFEAHVSMHRGLPTWFDEWETLGKNASEAIDLAYQVVAGLGKVRMKKDLTMRKTALIETVLMTTSEKSPEALVASVKGFRTRPLGLFRRIMEVKADENFFKHYLTGEKIDPREIHLYVNRNWGHFGKRYIEFLNEVMKNPALKQELIAYADKAYEVFAQFELRGLEHAYVAQASVLWCLEKIGVLSQEERELLLEKLMENAQENSRTFTENTDIVDIFYTALRDYYFANRKLFFDPDYYLSLLEQYKDDPEIARSIGRDHMVGARYGIDLFIFPTLFEEICLKQGLAPKQVLQEADKKGLLKRRESDRKSRTYQTVMTILGDPTRGYYFLNVFSQEEAQASGGADRHKSSAHIFMSF